MNKWRRRAQSATWAAATALLVLTPSFMSVPRLAYSWNSPFSTFLRQTSPISSSSLSNWGEPSASQRIKLVGTAQALDGSEAECVRFPPAPQSYKVSYFTWFRNGAGLEGHIYLKAYSPEDIGKAVDIRLMRQPAFEGEEYSSRASEVKLYLSSQWAPVNLSVAGQGHDEATIISSLSVINPSSVEFVQLCASHAAVMTTSPIGSTHFSNPMDWLFADPPATSARIVALGIGSILFGLLVLAFYAARDALALLPRTVPLAVFASLLIGFLVSALSDYFSEGYLLLHRLQGFSSHPNVLAASFVSIAIGIWAWSRRLSWTVSAFLACAFLVALTGSRAGAAAMLLIGVGLPFAERLRESSIRTRVIAYFGLGIVALLGLLVAHTLRGEPDALGRVTIWHTALCLLMARPFGWGLSMSGPALTSTLGPSEGILVSHAHNLFLDIGVELGIFPLLLAVTLAIYLYAQAWRSNHAGRVIILTALLPLAIVDVSIAQPIVYLPLLVAFSGERLRN